MQYIDTMKGPMSVDGRYKKVDGVSINEYDLQKGSGVLEMTERRDHYTATVFPSSQVKKNLTYYAYSRPVIGWSPGCQSFMSRNEAYELFMKRFQINPIKATLGYSITSLVIILTLPCRLA